MILRSYLFRRITIVGVGLIGGSLGMAIKKNKLAKEVVGLSQQQSSLVSAIKAKAIDIGETDLQKGLRNADFVVLATPVASIIKLINAVNPYLKRGCIVTDVGSAKQEIVETAEKTLSAPGFFVGSHPMAGSDKSGVDNATAELFKGSLCLMTPTDKTNQGAVKRVKQFWTKIGANVKVLTPHEHDEILSYVSHLPHLLAYSLMETLPNKYLEYASSGIKDTTRIAASSPKLWTEISLANPKNIVKAIDEYVKILADIRKSIVNRDQKNLLYHLNRAKENRDELVK